MGNKRFEVKKKHLKLLKELYINSYDEHGTPCVDSKRPFGNSDVTRDMFAIQATNMVTIGKMLKNDNDRKR